MLTMFTTLFGQSKAESRQDHRPHIIELPNKVSHVQQRHMSVQATEMSAIKFVRSVRIRPAIRRAVIRKLTQEHTGLGVLPSQLGP